MAEIFKKPSLQATVSPAGWRSIKVATQQAPESPLINLAKSLNVAGKIGQQYAGLEAFEYKQGVKEGQIAAASADLDEAIEGLDAAGEKLVEQGLMPRSQLFGYQKGFRKHIGQREAKANFFGGLQGRLKEVEMNPENGNYDIIDQIMQEEETASIERLRQAGGSELALQGFSEFSSEIKDRFKIQATQNRDKAIQKFNNNMYIEDFNQEFGERLTAATTPEDIATLQSDLKITMDNMTSQGKIPRSQVVELFFNGFMVPNVNNLLVGDDPQPDKAERVLDSLLDIDLTGKGGKLGNINREGAYIRSKAVELRGRIETARRAVEQDEGLKARDIVNLYTPAAQAVAGGLTGDAELDSLQRGAIMQFLMDAGLSEDEAGEEAEGLIRSQDLARLKSLGLNYRYNDAKRDAWNAATVPILNFETALIQKSQMVLPKAVAEEVIADITSRLEDDAGANVNEMLATGMDTGAPITDPRVKAEANRLSLQAKQNIWFEGTDAKTNYDRELSKALDAVVDVDLIESFDLEEAAKRTEVKAEGRARFEEEYKNKLRSLQRSLVNDPDREAKIIQEIPKIQTEIKERWKDFKTLELEFETGRLKEMMQEEEPPTFPQIPDLEKAKENIDDVLNSWSDGLFKTYAPSLFGILEMGPMGETGIAAIAETKSKQLEFRERLFSADIPVNAKDRSVAFIQADYIEEQIKEGATYEGNNDLIDGLKLIRQFYGYRNPSEIKPGDASELDFRFTPMYESEAALLTESTQAWREITTYQKSPETEDIDKFPVYKLYNETFGINTVQQLQAFVNTQKAVLKTKNQ
jgi:hypothetical protein